jgi:hypothetical protein
MQYQVDVSIDGQYYYRIYKHVIQGPLFFTDDYNTEAQAIEVAEAIIRDHRAMTGEL